MPFTHDAEGPTGAGSGKLGRPLVMLVAVGLVYAVTMQGGSGARLDRLRSSAPTVLPSESRGTPRPSIEATPQWLRALGPITLDTLDSQVLAADSGEAGGEADAGEPTGGPGPRPNVVVPGSTDDDESRLVAANQARILGHVVQSGETLTSIAIRYGVAVNTLIAANQLADVDRIVPGQRLQVPTIDGALHVVQAGESLWEIARLYDVDIDVIVEVNQLLDPHALRVDQRLIVPGVQDLVAQWRQDMLVSRSGELLRNFSWPANGWISSGFGPRWERQHEGIDIAIPVGTTVRASAPGRVTFAGWGGSYGYLVVVDHGRGVETRYAHNSQVLVRSGQRVGRGEAIARSGNTGHSTGPHLHFEIRLQRRPVNPQLYLR